MINHKSLIYQLKQYPQIGKANPKQTPEEASDAATKALADSHAKLAAAQKNAQIN